MNTNFRRSIAAISQDGWLVILVYFSIFSWSRWVSPNGWAGFYQRTKDRVVKGRTWLQDIVHVTWVILSITAFYNLSTSKASSNYFILSLSSFRIADLFIDFVMLAVFGNRYGRPWAGAMQPQRLQRTLIIDILLLLELVFWNACWIFIVSQMDEALYQEHIKTPDQALHLSMSTATTIGYGTYAPIKTSVILPAFLEALSALLLITGVIGSVFSRISSAQDELKRTELPKRAGELTGLPILWDDGWGWRIRYVCPIAVPALLIGGATFWLIGSGAIP